MTTEEDVARALRLADELEEDDDLRGALAVVSETAARAPSPKLHALKGRLLYLLEHHSAAIQSFDAALAVIPGAVTTRYLRARAKAANNDLDGALADFAECVRLEPTASDALYQIAQIHETRGDLQQALRYFESARAASGETPDDLEQRIVALRKRLSRRSPAND